MTFRVREASELSASESASLRRLDAEAFVSEDEIDLLGRKMEWAPPRWHLACWNNDEAICHVGIILRTGTLNGVEVAIGGVGGVATSPASQGKGLSSEGLVRALDFLKELSVDFGLLICREELIPFYRKRGWNLYTDPVAIIQSGKRTFFSLSSVVVCPIGIASKIEGTIDLNGPPW